MKQLILWTISVFGFAYVIGHSQISLTFREWLARQRFGLFLVQLLECPACSSFHVGWVIALAHVGLLPNPFMSAFYFSGASFILARLTGLILPTWPREATNVWENETPISKL